MIAAWEPELQPHDRRLSERLAELENRLETLAGSGAGQGAGAGPPAESQAVAPAMRGELQGWLEESVAAHMAEVELRLQAESERDRKQMLDAFVENVQRRVIQRISHLEQEVAGQSAAMSELRECSLRTERSIQKLLGGLDRLVVKEPVVKEPPADPASAYSKEAVPALPDLPAVAPAFASPPARSSRWKIFG
jgi:hypothetical protein